MGGGICSWLTDSSALFSEDKPTERAFPRAAQSGSLLLTGTKQFVYMDTQCRVMETNEGVRGMGGREKRKGEQTGTVVC